MIRQLFIFFLMVIFLSSCLKQSIADAMIADQDPGAKGVATLTYQINGNTVTTTVNGPDDQTSTDYQLICSKEPYLSTNLFLYSLDCLSTTGELTFTFGTALTVGHYAYLGSYGDMFILNYNNQAEYAHDPADSISFNITSYSQGHISGNFSGILTPMIVAGNPNNTYGTPGSVLITNGSFKNVPVFSW
jgi:hypothetical protein